MPRHEDWEVRTVGVPVCLVYQSSMYIPNNLSIQNVSGSFLLCIFKTLVFCNAGFNF